ncbi:DUF378 domain-containing protein [archaeon]|jgi:uncharacterized protein|nr:DUF378 domain-containing protein [archaeon]
MEKNVIYWITMVLLIIGGLNWGLIGAFNFNLVSSIFGTGIILDIVYSLVGIFAIWAIVLVSKK